MNRPFTAAAACLALALVPHDFADELTDDCKARRARTVEEIEAFMKGDRANGTTDPARSKGCTISCSAQSPTRHALASGSCRRVGAAPGCGRPLSACAPLPDAARRSRPAGIRRDVTRSPRDAEQQLIGHPLEASRGEIDEHVV
jgi:hypothetical protein